VLLSLVYLALRFVLQLLVLSFRSEEFKELEIVVLRHELAVVRGQVAAIGVVLAVSLLPRRRRKPEDEHLEAIAFSFARCPGAPYCGHLARVVAFGRRMRGVLARS
jgi:hypothetical protein